MILKKQIRNIGRGTSDTKNFSYNSSTRWIKRCSTKNIRLLAGKPLIAWSIEEAKKSKYISKVILTSEDDEIIEVAKQFGCDVPFKRPIELAQDESSSIDTVIHAIKSVGSDLYDYVVLLQPTSPLRTVHDIDGCIEMMLSQNIDFCVSVTEPSKSPYWMYKVSEDGTMQPLIEQTEIVARRQDLPTVYTLNGAVYVAKVEKLFQEKSFLTSNTKACIMQPEHSFDIDTELDFIICEQILKLKES